MNKWNYRIVKYADGSGFGLHEVYYDENGDPQAMTAGPVAFSVPPDEGPDGVQNSLAMAAADAFSRSVFHEPKTWKSGSV
jgi:hypothetical protein